MANWLVEIDWHPSDRRLRQFASGWLVGLPLVGCIWSRGDWVVVAVMAAVGAALAGLGLAWPKAMRPLYLGLTLVAVLIGLALLEAALAIVFFGLFLPVGLVFRLIGRDALERKIDANAKSYWKEKKQPKDAGSYLRQW